MKIIGAYDKQNNNYIFPQNASKKRKYCCPDCGEDLIFKKGSIVIPHFSHKPNSKCTYYDNPNESQIHKDAKNKLAQWLQDKKPLKIKTKCSSCNGPCKNKKIKYKDNDKVIVEYISQCKKYIADVAIINNDNVRYVLEVTNTHRTIDNAAEVRPEPWFDINADEIVNTDFDKDKVKLNCIRTDCSRFCNNCKESKNYIEQAKELFKDVYDRKEIEIDWECILCGKEPGTDCVNILPTYNIVYDYKFKNINIDIAIFNKEKIKYFIIFNENIIDKIPEDIRWFYFKPEQFIEQYKDYKDEDKFFSKCDKSNFGQYCYYSFCIEEKWISNIPVEDSYDTCIVCRTNNDFVRFYYDGFYRNLPEGIRVCYNCNFSNCRDKLIKYQNSWKKEIVHNNYIIYLNVPYNEKNYAKKLGAKWDNEKKKWYAPIYEQEKFSRWLNNYKQKTNNKFQQKNEDELCKKCGKFNYNHTKYCNLCKNDMNAVKLEINKYIRKRNY